MLAVSFLFKVYHRAVEFKLTESYLPDNVAASFLRNFLQTVDVPAAGNSCSVQFPETFHVRQKNSSLLKRFKCHAIFLATFFTANLIISCSFLDALHILKRVLF